MVPVDDIRHKKVREFVQVHLGRHPPGGGLVFVFLHQDLPLREFGQVRFVVGELVIGFRDMFCLKKVYRVLKNPNHWSPARN